MLINGKHISADDLAEVKNPYKVVFPEHGGP